MAQLLVTLPNGKTRAIALPMAATTIGRHPGNVLALDSPLVSRHHAVIESQGPFFTIKDAGSLNGTFVNGSPVQMQALADGDTIGIGDCLMRFSQTDQEAVSEEAIKRISERGLLQRP